MGNLINFVDSQVFNSKRRRNVSVRNTYMRKFREIKTVTLILKALLNPLAKKPPNGPMTEAKIDINNECNKNG